MSGLRNKTLGYRRAEWIYDKPDMPTLESCIRDAFAALTTVEARRLWTGSKEVKCLAYEMIKDGGVLLHISVDTPGEQASVVPKGDDTSLQLDVAILDAPEQAEFMDGDAFVFVKKDHACLCLTGMHDAAFRIYLYEMFKKAKLRQDTQQFDLLKLADIDKIKMIHDEKIKEIELKASLYKASADYARRKNEAIGIIGGAAKIIRAFGTAPHDVTNDSLRVILTIKTDERSKEHLALGEKRIEDIAVDLLEHQEEGDEFKIITKKGRTISPKELYVKQGVDILVYGKSVDREDAWKKLRGFLISLENSGVLDKS